jgi:hypothetical protein
MLKSAAGKKSKHSSKRKISNEKEFSLMNQLKQVPDIIERRVASIELRRKFLEGQNIRNNASEKQRLMNYRLNHRADLMLGGRAGQLARVRDQALADRVAQLDENPANRPFLQQNPIFRQPLIGEQPRYFLA